MISVSAEEQAAAIGRVVMDASDSKQKLAALRANLTKVCEHLSRASQMVVGLAEVSPYREADIEEAIRAIPSPDAVSSLVKEFHAESKRAAQLKAQIAQLGL